jgi:osmotically-inducible protein OsmY
MSDATLQLAVKNELMWDPKVDAAAISVSVDGGMVTLEGTVGSLRQKIEAGRDAKRVFGVVDVDNELQVRILTSDRKDDAEVRGLVLQALRLNSLVPSTIDAQVKDGVVTLTGTANWQFERDEAEYVANNVPGVQAVGSNINLQPGPTTGDVVGSIQGASQRLADINADQINVRTTNGEVTLSGTVPSWTAHDEAVDAAWSAPGVTNVVDNIAVSY